MEKFLPRRRRNEIYQFLKDWNFPFDIQGILIVCMVGRIEFYEIVQCVLFSKFLHWTVAGFSSIESKRNLFEFKYLFLGDGKW